MHLSYHLHTWPSLQNHNPYFSLLMEEPRRTLSSKSWMFWPAFQPPASVTWVQNALGEGGVGTMELFVGPHPTVLHLTDPMVRQIGTQDARVYSRP